MEKREYKGLHVLIEEKQVRSGVKLRATIKKNPAEEKLLHALYDYPEEREKGLKRFEKTPDVETRKDLLFNDAKLWIDERRLQAKEVLDEYDE